LLLIFKAAVDQQAFVVDRLGGASGNAKWNANNMYSSMLIDIHELTVVY